MPARIVSYPASSTRSLGYQISRSSYSGPTRMRNLPRAMRRNLLRAVKPAHVALLALLPLAACSRDVAVYVTTGDRAKLLARQPDVKLARATGDSTTAIVIDAGRRYQEIVGFGAALTDASAWLIQNKLTAPQREALI